jgi:5-methylcytosine-specific restriction endonuclease McrA
MKPCKVETCFYCDKIIFRKTTTKDHIIPKMLGGTNHPTNIVKACLKCNSLKTNFMPRHLAELIEWFFIPRAKDEEEISYFRKIFLKCIDIDINHIPKYKKLMIKPPFKL